MTQTVDIYVNNVKVMTAVATAGSATLGTVADVVGAGHSDKLGGAYAKSGSDTADNQRGFQDHPDMLQYQAAGTGRKAPHWPAWHGDVMIQATSGANALGRSMRTRIITDDGTTGLVMRDKWPFAD